MTCRSIYGPLSIRDHRGTRGNAPGRKLRARDSADTAQGTFDTFRAGS
jgi:hypothetical protein